MSGKGGAISAEHDQRVAEVQDAVVQSGLALLWKVRARRTLCRCMGAGAADLCGMVLGPGVFLAIEIKTGGGVKRADQRAWHSAVHGGGGIAITCETAAQAMALLRSELVPYADRQLLEHSASSCIHGSPACDECIAYDTVAANST